MKKLLFLFILIFTAFSVSALASAFDVGVNLSYNNADEVVDESVYSGSLNLDKIAVGLEMRGNISNFQMTIAGDISILDTQSVMFSGIFGAGISVDLFKYLKFGITTGPKVTYIYRGKMNSVDNNGDLIEADNFFTALAKGDFHYRLMFDVLAGPVMSIGVAYTIPTSFNIAECPWPELLPSKENLEKGQVAICIQMKVF
ncbi:MAG: hypothetical protein IKP61_01705 [Spirochaetales bacterium]|nr:hypothetical protein [Spirochaetales bacterium]